MKIPALTMLLACCRVTLAQTPPPTILVVDIENMVEYQADISDLSKFASNPDPAPSVNFRDFSVATLLGDIVAVNGQPAKGLYAGRARAIATDPSATPGGGRIGQAIGDTQHAAIREEIMEILGTDGTAIGTVVSLGLSGGPPPPGSPAAQARQNIAIVGGTGAFTGVRGTLGIAMNPDDEPDARAASMAEDPANRRINGGGKNRRVLTLFPMSAPEILAITHADSAAVSASNPAKSGETLCVSAAGLGPTRPGVDPGKPFPSSPAMRVNSPLQVTVNGKIAELIAATGSPGAVDRYEVKFRVPPGMEKGTATVQLSAAWIAGAPVTIAVQ